MALSDTQPDLRTPGFYADVEVNGKPLSLFVDTGSSVSILSKELFTRYFVQPSGSDCRLVAPPKKLKDYSGTIVPLLGCFQALVTFRNRTTEILFYVVSNGRSLLGIDATHKLNMILAGDSLQCCGTSTQPIPVNPEFSAGAPASPPRELPRVPSNTSQNITSGTVGHLPDRFNHFEHLFTPGLGLVHGVTHQVRIRPEVSPQRLKLRRLPLTLREPVKQEIENLLRQDVIERVSASEWVSPIVVVRKQNGAIRMCVDLRAPNQAIIVDSFPLPHAEDLLQSLQGAKWFSKLDLASAYHQVTLHEDSRDLTTFVTHEGLFRFKRVCFGLASAPSAFQQLMHQILSGCSGVKFYIDDIIVFGSTQKEHDDNLGKVLTRIASSGLKLNDKCVFDVQELSFIGHKISAQGISPLEKNVQQVETFSRPSNPTQLRSFLGLTEYYSKFVPHMAHVVEPLRQLLRKDVPFNWDVAAENSFQQVKKYLRDAPILSLFDPTLPIVVSTDASDYGLGAVLQQTDGENTRTIQFASRSLSPAERRYSTGEKEALACLWACEKWHVYLWGRKFTLLTDHQALATLLSEKGSGRKPLRIGRWTARLLNYTFTVQYRKGEQNKVADALSRNPLDTSEPSFAFEEEVVAQVEAMISKLEVQQATTCNTALRQVMEYTINSWPARKQLPKELHPYYEVRSELSVVDSILLRGDQVVLPSQLQKQALALAHAGHPGIVRMQDLIRCTYWWPAFRKHVEQYVSDCQICNSADKSAKSQQGPIEPTEYPPRPWVKVAVDIMGPFHSAPQDCRYAIVMVDYYSKWPEVMFTSCVTSQSVIGFLTSVFSREGLPEEIVTDNGPQFTSVEFETYLTTEGIKHIRSSLYFPQSNGQVERFNRVLKSFIQCALQEQRPLKRTVLDYVAIYRTIPHTATKLSPFYLLRGRQPRTRLHIVGFSAHSFHENPYNEYQELRQRVECYQRKMQEDANRRRPAYHNSFQPGDQVRVHQKGQGKASSQYSRPRVIYSKVARNTYRLNDSTTWHASKLSKSTLKEPPTQSPQRYDYPIPIPQTDSVPPSLPPPVPPTVSPPVSLQVPRDTQDAQLRQDVESSESRQRSSSLTSRHQPLHRSARPQRERRRPQYLEDYIA